MRKSLFILLLTLHLAVVAQPSVDILGEGFSAERFDMGRDYSGEVCSTLIRTLPIIEGRDAILYVHGYNDYFFQADMARRFHDSTYNFYAVDLRRYGRSISEGDTPFEVRDLREYFADIDSAVDVIRREGARRVILMGHSTGGLTTSYYLGCKGDSASVDGLILNSPFLAQNVGWFLQSVALPIVSFVGRYLPDVEVLQDGSTLYYESLHRDARGEWEFLRELKMPISPPITAGWIRAIDLAQQSVQRGYSHSIPTLLLYSSRSVYTTVWTEDMMRGDAVLNVEHMKRYGGNLGVAVTQVEIKDGMHDIMLSNYEARESGYRAIFEWLDR